MLEFGNKEFRNIQQQVAKNQEDIERGLKGIKISYSVDFSELAGLTTEANYGKYILVSHNGKDYLYVITHRANDGLLADNLGEWPAKIPGAQGPEGPQGPQGERGPAVYGTASSLPQVNDYKLGDFYLLTTGECYKAVLSNGVKTWVLQANYRGPQGPAGDAGDEVQANPGQTTDVLHSIGIDGINYALESELTSADRAMLNNLETNMEWETDGSATFGHDIYADGNIEAGYDVTVGRKLYIDDITKIQDPDGNEIAQGKLTAGDNVSIVNNVISAVSGATTWGAISGTLSNQTDLNTALNSKQSTISDLSTIRSGASAGATAVQPAAITDMATKTWVEGKGYLTQHQSLAAYRTSAAQDIIDQNIREVAEGKCKTYVVSYNNIAPTEQTFADKTYLKPDGTQILTWSDFKDYVGSGTSLYEEGYCVNPFLNTQNNRVDFSTYGYLLSYKETDTYYVLRCAYGGEPSHEADLKKGDIILIVQTNVPDRWFNGVSLLYKLETSKVDLGWSSIGTVSDPKPTTISGYGITDAYTKTEVNGLFYTKEQSQSVFPKIVDTRNLVFENISLENAYLSSVITKQEIMDGSGVDNWGFEGLSTNISENKSNKWFILFKVKSPVYTQAISWANIGITEYKNSTHWTQFGVSRSGQLGQNIKGDTKNPWSCESRSDQSISGLDPNEFYISMYKNDTTYIIKLYDKNGNIVFNQTYTNDDLFLDAISQGSETVPIISSRFVGFDIGQVVFKKGQDADLFSATDNINVLLKYSSTFTFTSWFSDSSFNSLNYIYSKIVTQNELDSKQNTISDLSTIRSGASAGATAVQPSAMNSKDFIQENAGHKFVVEHGNEFNMYKDGAEYCWLNYRGNMKELKVGDGLGSGTLGQITCKTIKLGNTVLTESQLIALLNLLN